MLGSVAAELDDFDDLAEASASSLLSLPAMFDQEEATTPHETTRAANVAGPLSRKRSLGVPREQAQIPMQMRAPKRPERIEQAIAPKPMPRERSVWPLRIAIAIVLMLIALMIWWLV